MAADQHLVERVRTLLVDESDLHERAMFGGHAFLLAGHLTVSVSGDGGLLVRVGTDARASIIDETDAVPAVMGSRTMQGWVRVDAEHVATEAALAGWVEVGRSQVRSLPPKVPGR